MKVAVCGVPRAGKTTFALAASELLGIESRHTDDLKRPDHDWHKQAEHAAAWLSQPAPWIIEGVTVLLALHWSPLPDVLIWLPTPRQPLTRGQEILARECRSAWEQLEPRLGCLVLRGAEEAWTWLEA